ncbi:TPA: molybdopterin-dependent oxidoreductase [Klebsiella pneumoniae]|nr:molybdopterin-dependent oxidoreductase [Klebsiella pneumoniae]
MKTIRTTCPYCGVGCGVLASVDDAGQVSVRGDDQHPANLGRLCVKGAALGETTGLAGRLLTPEVDGQQVAWPQALAETAARLRQIIDQHGPQAVAFYASGQLLTEDYYAANKLMKGFIGAANIDTNSRLCMSSAVTGYKRAFGADVVPCSYDDVENSDLVVLVGSNAAWAHPVLFQRLAQAKRDNPRLRIVAIDPRRTATCEIADRHLALAPGSDGGLFAGLLNALAEAGACVDGFRDGPQALAAARGWDVARVAAFCGLPADEVAGFYREFIAAPRAITLYTMGINQSASGSDKCNAIINVHLASGKYGRRGCGPFSLTGQPNAMGGREVGGLATMLAAHMDFVPDDLQRLARFWGTERLAQTPGLTAVELFAAIGRGEVKAVWIMGTNPVVSLPDSHAVSQALAACPLVIVSDVAAQTDTGRFAHIRFPALAWGEKNGTVTNSERRISRQRSFLPPPGEAKADWWIIARVGQALGYREAFAWQHPHDVFREHAALSGFENDGQRAFDIGSLFVPMHWNNQFARQGRVNNLLAAVTDPYSGQPESKQAAVAIAAWQPAWHSELFCREPLPFPAAWHWRRRATPGVLHYSLAGEASARQWLSAWCARRGWQLQVADGGAVWNLLAWHQGRLMLGWWSDAREPAVDCAWISAAFAAPPSDAAQRHALLSGRPGAAVAPRGRIVCSCFGVGEWSINEAIASGCASVGALGGKLKCGTNCGSCVPELNALLAAQRTRA